MWVKYNANPKALRVGDCTVRAISRSTEQSWERVYLDMAVEGLFLHDMPSSNATWGSYLHRLGWHREIAPEVDYTVKQFADEHSTGKYILALSGHVVACVDGSYYDTWDSGDETVVYYWHKEDE